ncbi:CYGN protein, partial [Podargus strigoides]|nr:CYGN protein [Podargus strigoides]
MRFLYIVFAVFLLISLATPGYGQKRKPCPKIGYCSHRCAKLHTSIYSSDCKYFCCIPPVWKVK